jgi:hypothetical protein
MLKKSEGYDICLSVDFRCFDNTLPDFGVGKFLDLLGFVPHKLLNHETYMDQIHTHAGVIDDAALEPHWTSQRAMPGAQVWTKRQYKGLIDELHRHDIKIYHGAEAAWSYWPEYGLRSRANWIYENLAEAFIIHDNGVSSAAGMGAINPLRRFSDGTYYADRICRDVSRFLLDYGQDGFFAADGFAGHHCQVKNGDYAPDMIEQFTEHSGIAVPPGPVPERAAFIWEKHRYEWVVFYSDRWASFHGKLSGAMKAIGKDLISFTPFQLGPCDSLLNYGFDYTKSHRAGLTTICLEAMEEITGRRFQGSQGWESIGICNVATTKALAPDINILWTSATCNCPEHWHTLRDLPNIIERECLALGTTTFIDHAGKRKRAFEGVLTIFGIDLTAREWRWLKERLDLGFGFEVESNLGPAVLWSDGILHEHARRGVGWPISATVAKMRFAGIPIQCAVAMENIPRAKQNSFLLVEPLGVTDREVAILEQAVSAGAVLIVAGAVENPKLLELLGIARMEGSAPSRSWRIPAEMESLGISADTLPATEGRSECDLHGYQTVKAVSAANVLSGDGKISGTAVALHAHGNGKCVFIRRAYETMPSFLVEQTAEEKRGTPRVHGQQDPAMKSTRELMESLAKVHPDALDLIAAGLIQAADRSLPRCDKGQLLGFKAADGCDYLLVENSASLVYATVHVELPKTKASVEEFPHKPIGPVGYIFYGDPNDQSFDVCVPPDAGIPVKIRYAKDR